MALLCDDGFGDIGGRFDGLLPVQVVVRAGLGLGAGQIIFFAVDEDDDIGVLLDGA